MKLSTTSIFAVLVLGSTGCMSDQTRSMAETCQGLRERSDRSDVRSFIQDAEKQLSSLNKPQNKASIFLRDLQDPEAMTYKPALEQCLWLLKSRQS
jgi:hypothetical protein